MSSLKRRKPSLDDGRVLVGFKAAPELAQQLKILCAIDRCTYQELFVNALRDRLDQLNEEKGLGGNEKPTRVVRRMIQARSAA